MATTSCTPPAGPVALPKPKAAVPFDDNHNMPFVKMLVALIGVARSTGTVDEGHFSVAFCSAIFGLVDLLPDTFLLHPHEMQQQRLHQFITSILAYYDKKPVIFAKTAHMRLKLFAYRILADMFDQVYQDNKTWLFDNQDLTVQAAHLLQHRPVPLTPRQEKMIRVCMLFCNPTEVQHMLLQNVIFDYDN